MTTYLSSSSTFSGTSSLGLPAASVHSKLDECNWQRWFLPASLSPPPPPPSPMLRLITPSNGFPSWWIVVYCASRTVPHLPWEEQRAHPDSEPRIVHNLDNYFHRWIPFQAEWWSGYLHLETIARKQCGLWQRTEIQSCRDLCPRLIFKLLFLQLYRILCSWTVHSPLLVHHFEILFFSSLSKTKNQKSFLARAYRVLKDPLGICIYFLV